MDKSKLAREGHGVFAQLFFDGAQLGKGLIVDGDALFTAQSAHIHFFFAVGIDALAAVGLVAAAEFEQIFGEALSDFGLVAEDAVVDGDEAVADAGAAVLGLVDALSRHAACKNAAEQFADHTKTVSLVAAHQLAGAAQRQVKEDMTADLEKARGN